MLAKGYGAWGAAGRIGSYDEFLCIIKDGTWVRVRPAGGSHKIPRYWLYFASDKVYRIGDEELDLFLENNTDVTDPREGITHEDGKDWFTGMVNLDDLEIKKWEDIKI